MTEDFDNFGDIKINLSYSEPPDYSFNILILKERKKTHLLSLN